MTSHDGYGTVEPTAGQRALARSLWGTYVALCEVGFNGDDALAIINSMTAGVSGSVVVAPDDTRGLG